MKIIRVTKLIKAKTRELCKALLPQYKYVRVKNSGLVILKKCFFSFSKEVVNITDLYIDTFPTLLAHKCEAKGFGNTYRTLFSNDIYIMLELRQYGRGFNIVDYIYDKYNVLLREVPIITTVETATSLCFSSNSLLSLSTGYIPGFEKILITYQKADPVNKIVKEVHKIKSNLPRLLVQVGGLSFA